MSLATLELDLDVFSGPFDLLLTLVLREEVDLLELQLAEVVLAYLDHLEARGELDLETATEFIVLIAALLELKSRLMLTGEEEELLDIEPGAGRRGAARADARRAPLPRRGRPPGRAARSARTGVRFRAAPLPASLRRTIVQPADGSQDPGVLGAGDRPAAADAAGDQPAPHRRAAGHRRRAPGAPARAAAARRASASTRPCGGADRMTVAVTLFALLELYKRGEADWEQEESFGEIAVHAPAPSQAHAASRAPEGARGERRPGCDGCSGPRGTLRMWRRASGRHDRCVDDRAGAGNDRTRSLARTVEALLFLSHRSAERARAGRGHAGR